MMEYNKLCDVPKCKGANGLQIPKDKELREKWCSAIKKASNITKYNPLINSYVCKKHFKETDFIVKKKNATKKQFLKKGAIPSLFYFVEPTVNIKNETLEIYVSSLDVDFSIMVETIEVYEQGMIILFYFILSSIISVFYDHFILSSIISVF